MKYPYYNPNLHLTSALKALFITDAKATESLEEFFRDLTGKKYILLTNSCRTALFLAWKAIDKRGEVITSPLTCKVAIDPIVEIGNKPVFADVNTNSLNIATNDIAGRVTSSTIAIQAIHLGGISCEMDKINAIAERHKLLVIEDCAQSLGAKFNQKNTGSFGDIACFSLIKNAYGIGGGVLATNDQSLYKKAKVENSTYTKQSKFLISYRVIRNIVDTWRRNIIGRWLMNILLGLKGNQKNYQSVENQLKLISSYEKKIASSQLSKLNALHKKRIKTGVQYSHKLAAKSILYNKAYLENDSSFTKYYLYNPELKFTSIKQALSENGIEVKHLQQSTDSSIQDRLVSKNESKILGLSNYDKIHDSLLSLPLTETMNSDDIDTVVYSLASLIQK